MLDFLANTSDAYVNVSPGFVETLIQSRREELFTGLMRLRYPAGEILVFTFLDGAPQTLYRCLETSTEVIPRRSWQVALDLRDASVSHISMSVESMRVLQVVLEAPVSRVEEQAFALADLLKQVDRWISSAEPSIVHIHSEQIDRLYLMSGISRPLIETVSFENDTSKFSVNDVSFPTLLPPTQYQVTRYVSDWAHVAWQEHEVRLSFNPWMRLILNRFSELAGRILTERLCERISRKLKEEGWKISVSINGVANHQYFESVEKAVDVYFGIVLAFHEEASVAIGRRMAEELSHEVLAKLDANRREIILHMIYDQNRIDAATGRVWR
jgi:hypothetical protein